jgi:hypothetical protein
MGSLGDPETPPGGSLRLAGVTPHELLDQIIAVCAKSPIVIAYTVRTLDLDVLSMRVHLVDDSSIEVFYNEMTRKTTFALIDQALRIYGKDNAKLGWHVHPLDNPDAHAPCDPLSFETFLTEVEALRFSS